MSFLTAREISLQIIDQVKALGFYVGGVNPSHPATPMRLLQECKDNGISVWWDNDAQRIKAERV